MKHAEFKTARYIGTSTAAGTVIHKYQMIETPCKCGAKTCSRREGRTRKVRHDLEGRRVVYLQFDSVVRKCSGCRKVSREKIPLKLHSPKVSQHFKDLLDSSPLSEDQLAAEIYLTAASIRAVRMAPKKPWVPIDWTDEKELFLADNVGRLSIAQLAHKLQISESSVRRKIRELGVETGWKPEAPTKQAIASNPMKRYTSEDWQRKVGPVDFPVSPGWPAQPLTSKTMRGHIPPKAQRIARQGVDFRLIAELQAA